MLSIVFFCARRPRIRRRRECRYWFHFHSHLHFSLFSQHLNFHFLFSLLLSLLLSQCLNLHSKEVTCSFLVHTPTHVCCNFVNISQWDLFASISCRYLYLHWDHQNLWFGHFDLYHWKRFLAVQAVVNGLSRGVARRRDNPMQFRFIFVINDDGCHE